MVTMMTMTIAVVGNRWPLIWNMLFHTEYIVGVHTLNMNILLWQFERCSTAVQFSVSVFDKLHVWNRNDE